MNKYIKQLCTILILSGMVLSSGCQTRPSGANPEIDDAVTHIGLYTDLSNGGYEGFFAVTNLARYGDHGLGTFDGLDGELIMVDGQVYRADLNGSIAEASVSNETPYAVVTWFSADRMFDVEDMNDELFGRALDMRRRIQGVPQAIQVNGYFRSVTIRSVSRQEEPWKPLVDVIKTDTRTKELSDVSGTLIGYYYPETLSSLHPAGYHFHFIDENRTVGGHVLGFVIETARIHVDISPYLRVTLPEKASIPAISRPIDPAKFR